MTTAGSAAGEEITSPRDKPRWNAKIQEFLPFPSCPVWEQH